MKSDFFLDVNDTASAFSADFETGGLTPVLIKSFKDVVYKYYKHYSRNFPWRETSNPYHIVVSEIMLQQTQTERVKTKYIEFVQEFPEFTTLAEASLERVLKVWQGMGYNRRAIALKKIAERVVNEFNGELPGDIAVLETFPGIGKATARSIVAFAFNMPVVFIETNIRSVFIHFFLGDREGVKDSELLPLVEATLDRKNPRKWYNALMDYGVMLKKILPNPSRKSSHHRSQSRFEGSNRQLRGIILREVVAKPGIARKHLLASIKRDNDLINKCLEQLKEEGFIREEQDKYRISE
jgi:A/G-specific adenine glycosylase